MTTKVKNLGLTQYNDVLDAMKRFTNERGAEDNDEIWLTQHYSVFTQGQAGKSTHIISQSDIPVVKSDRGGQVTYHGPGQIVVYLLLDIKRRNLGIRRLVCLIERSIIELLNSAGVKATTKAKAPGVYVDNHGELEKIASLGLRVRKGCCYHGVSLNVDMDLTPFGFINPCGYPGLKVTQWFDVVPKENQFDIDEIESQFVAIIKSQLSQCV